MFRVNPDGRPLETLDCHTVIVPQYVTEINGYLSSLRGCSSVWVARAMDLKAQCRAMDPKEHDRAMGLKGHCRDMDLE